MDDTTQSRASEAAATKKRRSSILKSQRTVRTPFSELEFNVATPTDTAKSRRVSFSRRTGVAEFVTNEATTTWKNFYEEHNKSLESSGNDSGNSSKQIGHIGKRLFDQQFEEVEADLIGSLNPGFNYNNSIANVNFGQMTIVEHTTDLKLDQNNFELSNLTNTQTKVFGDELTMPQMGDNSQPIDINFSAINQIDGDDLDEIQKHLENNQNVRCHGPFDRQSMSEYIEVDLNCTHVTVKNDESDMSITDTIHSPKVQDVSKSISNEKLPSKDWVVDKENIAINPYATPKESANFAINEEPEKVLVFDGKRLTLQPDVPDIIAKCPQPQKVQPRKTIVLNVHDDLPNFIDDPHSSALGYISVADLKQNTEFDSDMSITKPLPKSVNSNSHKTIVYDDIGDIGEISFTQAVPSNVIQEKRRTIVYENETGNISITQAVPTNIIEKTDNRTVFYENETGNIKITQSVSREKRKTIVYEDEEANISITQALPPNIITENRTIIADDSGNLSITQAVPNIIIQNSPEKKQTIIYDDEIGTLSVTQSRTSKVDESNHERQMVVYKNESGNISITQVVPGNVIASANSAESRNVSVSQSQPLNIGKRQTIVFDDADISMTQAVPNRIISDLNTKVKEKRATIVFDSENADMSVTQAVDHDVLAAFKKENAKPIEKRRTVFDNADISLTQVINSEMLTAFNDDIPVPTKKRQNAFDHDVSFTQAIVCNVLSAYKDENVGPKEKRQTVFDDDNISMTQSINSEKLPALKAKVSGHNEQRQTVFDNIDVSITKAIDRHVLSVFNNENAEPCEKRQTVFDNADISITQAVDVNMLPAFETELVEPTEKRQTVFDNADISLTQTIDRDMLPDFNEETVEPSTEDKRLTVFDDGDISMTQTVDKNGIIENSRNELNRFKDAQEKAILNNDVSEGKPIDDNIDMTEISPKKSIVLEDHTNIPSSELENVNLDVSMNDIETHKNPIRIAKTSKNPNLQNIHIDVVEKINDIQPTNEILVYQLAPSSGQIQKGTEKGDAKSQPSVNTSSMDVDDEKLASNQITDLKDFDHQSLKNVDSHVENDDEQKLSNASCNDVVSTKSVSNDNDNSKSDVNSAESVPNNNEISKSDVQCARTPSITSKNSSEMGKKDILKPDVNSDAQTPSILSKTSSEMEKKDISKSDVHSAKTSSISSKNSSEMGKKTVTIYKEKDDAQSLSISQVSHDFDQNSKTDSIPKLTSRPPSALLLKPPKSKMKDSLLKDLLDMSKSSVDELDEQKPNAELFQPSKISTATHDGESSNGENQSTNDRLFYITKDDEDMKDGQKDTSPNSLDDVIERSPKKKLLLSLEDHEITKNNQSQKKPHLSLEYKEENPIADELQKKLALLETVYLDSHLPEKIKEKKIKETKISHQNEEEDILKEMNLSKCSKRFKLANDTKELLDMLSDLTERGSPKKGTLDPHLEEDEDKPEPVIVKGHIALENKAKEEIEPRRISFLPQRRSIVFSREDLLNNISMAGAALQKSRQELDDESIDESTISESPEQSIKKKAVRMSDEIVKTLKFDEDSINQTMDSDNNMTPLRKTAFGETTYMTDPKSKVIPSYMNDVSSDLKALMHDLVKPTADTLPFENSVPKKIASTCSIKLQANLITSSQIDVHTDLYSTPGSPININPEISSVDIIDDAVKRSVTRALRSPIKSVNLSSPESSKMMEIDQPRFHDMSDKKAVLIFDHANPLNNILLAPPAVGDVHKYNPPSLNSSFKQEMPQKPAPEIISECNSERSASVQISLPPIPSSEITQMNVSNRNSNYRSAMRKSLAKTESESKPSATDQSVDTRKGVEHKDVNTLIAMKKNKELLEANSSLTLVDGPLDRGPFWSNLEDNEKVEKKSEIELIYKDSQPEKLIDSDMTSNDSSERQLSKKRAYSPAQLEKHKHCTLSNLDLTPKPVSKMQKISETTPPEVSRAIILTTQKSKEAEKKKRHSKSPKKTEPTLMVQHVIAEYDIQSRPKSDEIRKDCVTPETNSFCGSEFQSPEHGSSFTSSKNLREDRSTVTVAGWQDPDPIISNNISETESHTNIVAKLDMLPFMGSYECEWESSTSELFSFRLLHSCLRLTIRLQHLHERAARCIRADTPVQDVQLDILHEEKKNAVGVLCVRFAAEAIRYEISSGCRVANDVPSLIKRCARVARLAMRWARAMQDIKARLAYTLTPDGLLSLKVANIPLRSVWEIRLKLDMVVNDSGAPWPRASALAVLRVLTDKQIHTKEVKQVLKDVPEDWGHAPRCIWRVFKYLKYKKEYEILSMEH